VGGYVKSVDQNSPLFFTGHKLHPPGISIEATDPDVNIDNNNRAAIVAYNIPKFVYRLLLKLWSKYRF